MRIAASVLLVLALTSPAAADGATVDLQFKDARVIDILRLLGDVGRINIVPVDIGDPTVDIRVKRVPWDKVLDQVAQMTKLAYHRTGNLILVGAPALIDARRKAPAATYTGPIVSLDVVDLDASDAALLLAATTGASRGIAPRAARRATLRLKKLPADHILDVLAVATAGTVAPITAPPKPTGCSLPKTSVRDARLAGIASHSEKRWALLRDPFGTAWIVQRGDCIGTERATTKDIGENFTVIATGADELALQLHP
jgi:type II secretory pathway component HofQ